jgi:hypothetical protein
MIPKVTNNLNFNNKSNSGNITNKKILVEKEQDCVSVDRSVEEYLILYNKKGLIEKYYER